MLREQHIHRDKIGSLRGQESQPKSAASHSDPCHSICAPLPKTYCVQVYKTLAKEEVMAHRNETSNLNPDDLDLSADFHTENIRIHEHLIPRLQQLLSEANKLKSTHQFQYVWVKNSEILARKSSSSQVFKLKRMADLDNLKQSLVSNPTQD